MNVVDAVKRPTGASSVVSLVAALAAVGLVVPAARVAFALELVGVGVLAAGAVLVRRDHPVAGAAVALLGVAVALGGLGLALSTARGIASVIVTLPAAVGLLFLGLALVPARGSGSRRLVKLGAGFAFVAVLASGLFRLVALQTLLVAGVGTIVAWDAGERAINVGEQLGRVATTRRLETAHAVGSLVVGAVAVGTGSVVADIGSPGLSLPALAALLVALLLLTAALHG